VPIDTVERFTAAIEELPATERVRWQRYRVASGDSLIAIARKHRTTPDVIREVNGLASDRIRVGEHLMIPTARKGLADYSLSAPNRLAATQNRPRAGRQQVSHTVKSGESFWTIARVHGIGVRELAAWNGMAPGDTLNVGRRLVVWKKGSGTSVSAAPADRRVRQVRYTVRTGDSLSLIATRFRVTVDDLRAWNGLEGGKYLQPGQKLVMFVDVTAQSGGG
jgi:membrane-bound lytic murein transglycosylase D